MDMIWHNYKMVHRNSRVIVGNIFDPLPCNHAQIRWAVDDRPYILSRKPSITNPETDRWIAAGWTADALFLCPSKIPFSQKLHISLQGVFS